MIATMVQDILVNLGVDAQLAGQAGSAVAGLVNPVVAEIADAIQPAVVGTVLEAGLEDLASAILDILPVIAMAKK